MSGHKRATVSISDEEYRKLHDAEVKLRFMDKELPRITAEINAESQEFINQQIKCINKRQQDFQNLISDFDGDIQRMEGNTFQAIYDQQRHLASTLDELASSVWQGTSEVLNKHFQEYETIYDQNQRENQELIQQIINSQDWREHNDLQKSEHARSWIDSGYALLQFINRNYPVEQSMMSELNNVDSKLDLANRNLQQGLMESAIMLAEDAYLEASGLHVKIEKEVNEYQLLRQACLDKAQFLHELVYQNRVCPAIDMDGNELPVQIDVDYWSNGKYNQVVRQIKFINTQLRDTQNQLNKKSLNDLIHRTLPSLQSELEQSLFESRLAVLNSQLRINIADLVVDALETQGYKLQESRYSNEDLRETYYARVRNLDGSEVVIEVAPVPGSYMHSDLKLHSLDEETRTEYELRQRAHELSNSLRVHGLQVGELETDSNAKPVAVTGAGQEFATSVSHLS